MSYSNRDFSESNVNYLTKDFLSLKANLIQYAKSYFPNSYRDFNETSPGMMLIEMSAYVGDVLSFYIDQQYKEMLLPLAEERRNVINIAKMLGYRPRPIIPAYAEITVTQVIDANTNNQEPDYTKCSIIDKEATLTSTIDSDIIFETLDIVDFTTSGSETGPWTTLATGQNSDGLTNEYTLTRKVRAVSGQTTTTTFNIGAPTKFLKLTISDTNVVDILSVVDTNGNKWYEVEYLAQDKIPIATHYYNDADRNNDIYTDFEGNSTTLPIPYTLEYIDSAKRFITEVNDDNTTSLIFGNGILRSGQTIQSQFIQTEQVGINLPGQTQDLATSINPLLGDVYATLGETPNQTTLTVTYRIGGGLASNVPSNDLTLESTPTLIYSGGGTITATNITPARGGSNQETIDEIKNRTKGFFATQNRCVTKEDYEARTLHMPSKFGNIAKVYANRRDLPTTAAFEEAALLAQWQCEAFDTDGFTPLPISYYNTLEECTTGCWGLEATPVAGICTEVTGEDALINLAEFQTIFGGSELGHIPTIDLTTLSYDINKNLTYTPDLLFQNLKNYLNEYRIITDEVSFRDGFIINFGVVFEVVAHRQANKQDVKLRCIQAITDFLKIEKMQFRQPIYISQLEYELMGLDGVRAVNYVILTQEKNWKNGDSLEFNPALYSFTKSNTSGNDCTSQIEPDYYAYENSTFTFGDFCNNGNGFGWKYQFDLATEDGIVVPATVNSIFELKDPSQHIKGKVL